MDEKRVCLGKGWLLLIPSSLLLSSVLSLFYSDGLSFLWVIGSLSVAGSMLLVLLDKSLCRVASKVILLFQVAVLMLSVWAPEYSGNWTLSPRLVLFSIGTALAMCASLAVNLYSKSGDTEFLLGEYRGKEFLLDATRVVYSLLQITVILAVALTFWIESTVRMIVCIACTLVSVCLMALIALRFISMYKIEKTMSASEAPTEGEIQLYRQIQELLDDEKPFLDPNLNVDEICKQLGTNRSYISRSINACTGLSVPRYINNRRVLYAMELYRNNLSLKVSELAVMSGFSNGVTFNTAFRLETDMSPRDWCRECRDEAAKEKKRLSRHLAQGLEQ